MSTPPDAPASPVSSSRPSRRIVLVAGPSGSGKGLLATRSGLPLVGLDEFYRDEGDPTLPQRYGIVDWDDPASWNAGAALEALTALAHDGTAEVPTYSIPLSRRTGTHRVDAGDAPLIIAEGIFAAELIAPLQAAGLLATAIVLERPVPLVFLLRLARDLREARKSPRVLLQRGWALAREQKSDVREWIQAGMEPLGLHAAVRQVRQLAQIAQAERHHRSLVPGRTLRITAVCFLRGDGADGELLTVRKHGTGSYMQVGGKLEPGEEAIDAARREVAEELGVHLEAEELELLGDFHAVAANEPGTQVHSTVFFTRHALPDPLTVQAELADHRWVSLRELPTGTRLAPLMVQHIVPALRERLG